MITENGIAVVHRSDDGAKLIRQLRRRVTNAVLHLLGLLGIVGYSFTTLFVKLAARSATQLYGLALTDAGEAFCDWNAAVAASVMRYSHPLTSKGR